MQSNGNTSEMTSASQEARKSEHSLASARASVMIYDDTTKKWIPSGTSSGLSKVHILQHVSQQTFRVVGRKLQDHEVVLNCAILKGLKYNQATPTFHQWRDNKQVYGLNFSSSDDAEAFARAMYHSLEILSNIQNNKPPHLPITNNNNLNNNNNNNSAIQQQQNNYNHQPNDEDMGYRTMTREDVASIQDRRISTNTLNSVNHIGTTTSLSSNSLVNSANSMNSPQNLQQVSPQSPAGSINSGHHRASSAPPAPNPPQLTLPQSFQPPMAPPLPPSNHGGQVASRNYQQQSSHYHQPPNHPMSQQHHTMPQQHHSINQQQIPPPPPPHGIQFNSNINSINNNCPPPLPKHAPGVIYSSPPPPPPPPMSAGGNTGSLSRSVSSDVCAQNTNIIQLQQAMTPQQEFSSSLAAQLQNARLKRNNSSNKSPAQQIQNSQTQVPIENSGSSTSSGSSSNYGTIGRGNSQSGSGGGSGGMASMMDEMAKTLARRRAAAERKDSVCDLSSSNEDGDILPNGKKSAVWEKTNTLPNNAKLLSQLESPKSIRKRFGSASEETILKVNGGVSTDNLNLSTMTLTPSDLEVFKHEMLREIEKSFNKMKLDIIDALKSELNCRR